MPADFLKCVSDGGRVRTINPKPGKYLRICYKDGKSYSGEVKSSKEHKQAMVRSKTSEAAKK
jgi:hypothetical protein